MVSWVYVAFSFMPLILCCKHLCGSKLVTGIGSSLDPVVFVMYHWCICFFCFIPSPSALESYSWHRGLCHQLPVAPSVYSMVFLQWLKRFRAAHYSSFGMVLVWLRGSLWSHGFALLWYRSSFGWNSIGWSSFEVISSVLILASGFFRVLWGCGSSTLNCNGGIDLASVSNVMLNEGVLLYVYLSLVNDFRIVWLLVLVPIRL